MGRRITVTVAVSARGRRLASRARAAGSLASRQLHLYNGHPSPWHTTNVSVSAQALPFSKSEAPIAFGRSSLSHKFNQVISCPLRTIIERHFASGALRAARAL